MEVFIHFGEGLSVDVVAPVINNKSWWGIISVHTFHSLEHLFSGNRLSLIMQVIREPSVEYIGFRMERSSVL